MVDIRIGIVDNQKEISLEVEQDAAELKKAVEAVMGDGDKMLWLTDHKGKQVGIPGAKVAYFEIDPETPARSVGFRP